MDAGLVGEVRNDCRIYVGESPRRMFRKDVATTSCAPLTITQRRRAVRADVLGSLYDLHRVGFPQREGVDRRSRPGSAGLAMAVVHCGRLTGHGEATAPQKQLPWYTFPLLMVDLLGGVRLSDRFWHCDGSLLSPPSRIEPNSFASWIVLSTEVKKWAGRSYSNRGARKSEWFLSFL